jgi:hypothetical protein
LISAATADVVSLEEPYAHMSAIVDFFESFGRAFSHLVWAFLLGIVAHLLPPESLPLTGRHHDAENDSEFGHVTRSRRARAGGHRVGRVAGSEQETVPGLARVRASSVRRPL